MYSVLENYSLLEGVIICSILPWGLNSPSENYHFSHSTLEDVPSRGPRKNNHGLADRALGSYVERIIASQIVLWGILNPL